MNRKSGFTLIEILIAMTIIGILSGVVGLSVAGYLRKAKLQAAQSQIKTFQTALQMYKAAHAQLPTTAQGLEALCIEPSIPPIPKDYPAEGYLESRKLPNDPWGNPYVYLVPGRKGEPYEIISYGSDGEEGGIGEAADISSGQF
jgi:general secretion pathway protein G